eukprot:COSAG06_NODE_45606_length_353_cov_1.015748_1_plen_63_part_10
MSYREVSDGPNEISCGLNCGAKVIIFIIVLVPKYVIGVTLLVFGGQFVQESETNQDVLFNSLA